MKACVNPKLVDGVPLSVVNPRTKREFPQGEAFDLSPEDMKHIGVRRLFPKSEAGGCYGDLLPAEKLSKGVNDGLKAVKQMLSKSDPEPDAGDGDGETAAEKKG